MRRSQALVQLLKAFLIVVWVWMAFIVISTSLRSSLFKEWSVLASIPWMRATLWDFYGNILIIYLYVLFRERAIIAKLVWAILFFCLGSLATIGYVLIQLYALKNSEGIEEIFKRRVTA